MSKAKHGSRYNKGPKLPKRARDEPLVDVSPAELKSALQEIQNGWTASERRKRNLLPSPPLRLPEGYDPYEHKKGSGKDEND